MKKGFISPSLAIVGIALFLTCSGPVPGNGQEKIVFSTPIKTAVHLDLPGAAAEEKGFWKQMGLNVEWIAFGSGRGQIEALAAGLVQAGATVSTQTITDISRGIPMILAADLKLGNDFSIWVPTDSKIREPRELKGVKIGIPRLGSVAHAYGIILARELALQKDIRLVGIGDIGAAIAALRKGAVDAILLTQFVMFSLKHQGVVRDLVSIRQYLPKQWIDVILFASRDSTKQRPEDLKKVIKAYQLATSFIMNNPDWAVEKMKTRLGHTEGAARAILPFLHWGYDWKIDSQAVKNVRDFLVEYGVIDKEKAPKLELLYTNDFVS